MKTTLLTICLLLATILSGCSQGDIYSCRKIIMVNNNYKEWVYDKREFSKAYIFTVKGNNLYEGDFEYRTPRESTENLVIGSYTSNKGKKYYWKLNTVDKFASWGMKTGRLEMHKCEKK